MMITRHEIEVTRSMRERSSRAVVDIYIAKAVDKAPVEPGADIAWVVAELYRMNVRELRKPIRWATILLLEDHLRLTRQLFRLRMQHIADNSAWRQAPGEIWRGLRSIATLAVIYARRRISPVHSPALSPAEWERLRAMQCNS